MRILAPSLIVQPLRRLGDENTIICNTIKTGLEKTHQEKLNLGHSEEKQIAQCGSFSPLTNGSKGGNGYPLDNSVAL